MIQQHRLSGRRSAWSGFLPILRLVILYLELRVYFVCKYFSNPLPRCTLRTATKTRDINCVQKTDKNHWICMCGVLCLWKCGKISHTPDMPMYIFLHCNLLFNSFSYKSICAYSNKSFFYISKKKIIHLNISMIGCVMMTECVHRLLNSLIVCIFLLKIFLKSNFMIITDKY